MEGVTINIFLSPEHFFEEQIIDLSLKIKQIYELSYYVDGERFYPHLSLLNMVLPEYNLEKVKTVAQEYFINYSGINIETMDIFCSISGIVMLRVKKNQQLTLLHNEILNIFNPLRDSLINDKYKEERYLEALYEKDRSLILKYGNKWVLDNYDPNITFARLKNINDFKDIKNMYESIISNNVTSCDSIKITREYFGVDNRSEIIFEQSLK